MGERLDTRNARDRENFTRPTDQIAFFGKEWNAVKESRLDRSYRATTTSFSEDANDLYTSKRVGRRSYLFEAGKQVMRGHQPSSS